jgi:hypothetical protein
VRAGGGARHTMSSPQTSGMRSPPPRDALSPSPRPRFDAELLRAYVKKLLATTLARAAWPDAKDRPRVKGWMKEIGERVKERMLGASPAPRAQPGANRTRRDRAAGLVSASARSVRPSRPPLTRARSKYIVLTQINENLGQGGRCVFCLFFLAWHPLSVLRSADMVCHWEDSDTVAQEMFVNVRGPAPFFGHVLTHVSCRSRSYVCASLLRCARGNRRGARAPLGIAGCCRIRGCSAYISQCYLGAPAQLILSSPHLQSWAGCQSLMASRTCAANSTTSPTSTLASACHAGVSAFRSPTLLCLAIT